MPRALATNRVVSAGRQLVGSAAFAPTDIAGLQLWLKADGVLWQDSGRTTLATADGDPVGAWDDGSGNGRHAVQATGAARPTLKLAIQNGKPVLRFDGTDDTLATAAFGSPIAQPTTVYLVYRNITDSGVRPVFDGAANRQAFLALFTGAAQMFAGTLLPGGASLAGAACRIVAAQFNGGSSQFWADGASQASGAAGANPLDRVGLMADALAGGGNISDGDLCEVLLYSGAHTNSQINQVANYLERWGPTWADL